MVSDYREEGSLCESDRRKHLFLMLSESVESIRFHMQARTVTDPNPLSQLAIDLKVAGSGTNRFIEIIPS